MTFGSCSDKPLNVNMTFSDTGSIAGIARLGSLERWEQIGISQSLGARFGCAFYCFLRAVVGGWPRSWFDNVSYIRRGRLIRGRSCTLLLEFCNQYCFFPGATTSQRHIMWRNSYKQHSKHGMSSDRSTLYN